MRIAPLLVDWSDIFSPGMPLAESMVRGTAIYLLLLVLLRLFPRRTIGSLGIMDLVLVVLIAETAGIAFGKSESVTDSGVLIATLIGWSYALNWATYRVPALERLLTPPPLLVIEQGRLLRRNMRAELITEDELTRQLREQGVDDLSEIKSAHVEADGSLSVVTYSSD